MSTLPARFRPDQEHRGGGAAMVTWDQLTPELPELVAAMRAYLVQVAVVLRPGSVNGADQTLRCFATYLLTHHPEVTCVLDVARTHIEGFKPWLAARPGRDGAPLAAATIAHRLGTLRMFFLRIDEWAWDDAPARVPMFPGDVPKQHHALPKALDDHTAARLLAAAQDDRRQLIGVTVEFLLRTGLRVGEYTAWPPTPSSSSAPPTGCTCPSASSTRTATYRCTPAWCSSSPTTGRRTYRPTIPCCCPGRTARPWTGTPSPGSSTGPAPRPGWATSTPTSCATPWPRRPSTAACRWRRSPRCSGTRRWT